MKWSDLFEQWRAEAAAEEAERTYCYDCLPFAKRIAVAKERWNQQARTLAPVGFTGSINCTRCGQPRTLLPNAADDVPAS